MLLIPREITADIASLLGALEREGFRAVSAHYDDQAFGNYSVEFVGSSTRLSVRPRPVTGTGWTALMLNSSNASDSGALSDPAEEFEEALVNWLRSGAA